MICEGITKKYEANSVTPDQEDQDYVPPVSVDEIEIDVASEEATPEAEISVSSVTDENTPKVSDNELDSEPVSIEKDPESEEKDKVEPIPETPVPQTDLSKSIVDFDLEKELAISIRGRSGRKQKAGEKKRGRKSKKGSTDSNEDKELDSTRSDEEGDKDVENELEPQIKTEEDVETDSNVDIKQEDSKSETDTVKSEVQDDIDADIKSEEEIKTEPEATEATEEILDSFELNVQEYLTGGKYEEPSTDKFELVADGIETLKGLIDKLVKEEDFQSKETKGRQRVS